MHSPSLEISPSQKKLWDRAWTRFPGRKLHTLFLKARQHNENIILNVHHGNSLDPISKLCLQCQKIDCGFKNFITLGANTRKSWLHADMGLDAEALKLPAIGKANFLAGKRHCQAAWQHQIRDVAIGASRRRANKGDVVRGRKPQAGVFGLTLRPLIDENGDFPLIGDAQAFGGVPSYRELSHGEPVDDDGVIDNPKGGRRCRAWSRFCSGRR